MMKRVLGVLAALAMVSGSVVACSSSSSTNTATPDGGKPDTGADTKTDSKPPTPVDGGDSGGPETSKTTGKTCMTDDDCDLVGDGINLCTAGAFGGDSLYPTSVCIGRECDPGDGGSIMGCDSNTGVCLKTQSGGICLPVCEFSDDGAAPKGCEGKNGCNVYGWGKDTMTMATIGVGYCFGGCKSDADCAGAAGNKCQVEQGLCVKTPVVYVKKVGDACTDADSTSMPEKCNCLYATTTKNGYCSKVCRVGETGTCDAGYTCDAMLPKDKLFADDTVFTKQPAGMMGYCLKDCTTDADCTNGYCDENAGTGKKTCQIGNRRCTDLKPCPAGKTCSGATATEPGTCM